MHKIIRITTLPEGIKAIKEQLSQRKYSSAKHIAQKLFEKFPRNNKVLRLLHKAENKEKKQLFKNVDKALTAIEHLWPEKNYLKLKKLYSKLYQLCPEHSRLAKKMNQLFVILNGIEQEEYENYVSSGEKKLKELLHEKKYQEAIHAALELIEVDHTNFAVPILLYQARKGYVEEKLPHEKIFLGKMDYRGLLNFYNTLLEIMPEHQELQRKIRQVTKIKAEIEHEQKMAKLGELYQRGLEYLSKKNLPKASDIYYTMAIVDAEESLTKKFGKKLEIMAQSRSEDDLVAEIQRETSLKKAKKDSVRI